MTRKEKIAYLLANPNMLLSKRPFFRGSTTYSSSNYQEDFNTSVLQNQPATLCDLYKTIVTQDKFLREYDPYSHEVMFDNNIPSICVKLDDNTYQEIKWKRMPLPLQQRIVEKITLSLCGNDREFLLEDDNPTEETKQNYATLLRYWKKRNQDGMTTMAVNKQLYLGDIALLYYFDYKGCIKSRLLSYDEGYTLISHNDDNGDRLMECLYYATSDGVKHIDCYTDDLIYCLVSDGESENGWKLERAEFHGFSEIPVVTKRGDVAWNNVQTLIEVYEIIYNIFLVIQKRHGWGILYIRGNFSERVKKIAGSIILNDRTPDGNGSAEFKAPPSPTGMIETLASILEQIQIGASVTFLLPKDVKSSGDISALAIMLTQSLDLEGASKKVIEWQNFISKCVRLFKEGLSSELVNSGENVYARTQFENMGVSCSFKIWRPFSKAEYNNMLVSLKAAGIISDLTATERCTESAPDEIARKSGEIKDEGITTSNTNISNEEGQSTNSNN